MIELRLIAFYQPNYTTMKQPPTIRDLYPHLTDEELEELTERNRII